MKQKSRYAPIVAAISEKRSLTPLLHKRVAKATILSVLLALIAAVPVPQAAGADRILWSVPPSSMRSASIDTTGDTPLHTPFVNEEGHLVEWYGPERELVDSSLAWYQGTRAAPGGCTFTVPDLQLEADQEVIAQRQVATDYTTCEVLVETGLPGPGSASTDPPNDEISSEYIWFGDATWDTRMGGDSGLDALLGGADTSAYYRIWWEDVLNIWVTKTTIDMWWGFNGSFVEYSNGSVYYQWRSGTGWSKYTNSIWTDKTISRHKYYTSVTYRNGIFCWPDTVWNYYSGQHVDGWYNGSRSGGYSSTWTTYPFACPTLHFHTQLGM